VVTALITHAEERLNINLTVVNQVILRAEILVRLAVGEVILHHLVHIKELAHQKLVAEKRNTKLHLVAVTIINAVMIAVDAIVGTKVNALISMVNTVIYPVGMKIVNVMNTVAIKMVGVWRKN